MSDAQKAQNSLITLQSDLLQMRADDRAAYADALTSMAARNPGMRILAISHDPTMKARFQQNITVTAGDNGSEVTVD